MIKYNLMICLHLKPGTPDLLLEESAHRAAPWGDFGRLLLLRLRQEVIVLNLIQTEGTTRACSRARSYQTPCRNLISVFLLIGKGEALMELSSE
jgi:hypothetical protein